MATLAKHLQVARTRGVEEGMEAYLSAPSSRRHPAYAEITRKRTQESRLNAYCKLFADKLGNINPRTPVQQERAMGDVQAIVEAAVQQALAGIAGTVAPAADNGSAEVEVEFITSGEAWKALIDLGDDPDFPAPQNPDRPATNGQLFRLNTVHGVLSLNV